MSNIAVSYAAVILADSDVEITADKLLALTKAANVDDVEPIFAQIYAKALAKQDTKALLTAFGASAGAGSDVAAVEAAASGDAAAAEEPSKKEESEESDMDMGIFF